METIYTIARYAGVAMGWIAFIFMMGAFTKVTYSLFMLGWSIV